MRVKNSVATRARRKKYIKKAEGSYGTRHKSYKNARQTVIKAGVYAFRDRRTKKRDFRKLWISRINSALTNENISYSKFIHQLKDANIDINRKMLSEMAISNPEAFSELVKKVSNQ